mgnify:CR=1 FL=1
MRVIKGAHGPGVALTREAGKRRSRNLTVAVAQGFQAHAHKIITSHLHTVTCLSQQTTLHLVETPLPAFFALLTVPPAAPKPSAPVFFFP